MIGGGKYDDPILQSTEADGLLGTPEYLVQASLSRLNPFYRWLWSVMSMFLKNCISSHNCKIGKFRMKIPIFSFFLRPAVLQGITTGNRAGTACLHTSPILLTPFTRPEGSVSDRKWASARIRDVSGCLCKLYSTKLTEFLSTSSSRHFNRFSMILHFSLTFLADHRKFNYLKYMEGSKHLYRNDDMEHQGLLWVARCNTVFAPIHIFTHSPVHTQAHRPSASQVRHSYKCSN